MLKSYKHFLSISNIDFTLPYPITNLLSFITYQHENGLAYSTLKANLSALSYFCKINNVKDSTKAYVLGQLLKGIKIYSPSLSKRCPLLPSHIKILLRNIPKLNLPYYSRILFNAMITLAFALALRIGEMTLSKHNLLFQNIILTHSSLFVSFHSFKHSVCGTTSDHIIHEQPSSICPVKHMRKYLALRGAFAGPLFISRNSAISRKQFSDFFRAAITVSKIKGFFTPHSFRIGAASWWSHQGLSDSQIRKKGRWQSDAFKTYLRGTITH